MGGAKCDDDGNACNGISHCSDGACVADVPAVDCGALDTECAAGACDAATGLCSAQAVNAAAACDDDGNACNGVSHCAEGLCVADVPAVDCGALDTECAAGVCDAGTGLCSAQAVNTGAVCTDDNDACNGVSHCAEGACVADTPVVDCSGLTDACSVGVCDAGTGSCSAQAANGGALCADDGNACNGVSHCAGGTCVQDVTPVDCSALDGECTSGVCDTADGACSAEFANTGGPCDDDSNACNGVSLCMFGACVQGQAPVDCSALDADCLVGVCDPADGACTAQAANPGAVCSDDADACNGISHCADGSCVQNVPVVDCSALDEACKTGVCNPADGSCAAQAANGGAVCGDDGDDCNGVSHCADGACTQDVQPVSCAQLDGECTAGQCNPVDGSCAAVAANAGAVCGDDGNACNGVSHCSDGACDQDVGPVDCSATDDACNDGVCQPATGACEPAPVPDGTLCLNPVYCDGAEICSKGQCAAGAPVVCDDGDPCTVDACDPAGDQCVSSEKACDAGQVCLGEGVCSVSSTLKPTVAKSVITAALVALTDGFAPAWYRSIYSQESGLGISAAKYDAAGKLLIGPTQVTEGNTIIGGNCAGLTGGGMACAWSLGSINYTVVSPELVSATGDLEADDASSQRQVAAAGLTGGGFVLAWDRGSLGVHARLFEADGTPVAAVFELATDVADTQFGVEAAATSNGGFAVAWSSGSMADYPFTSSPSTGTADGSGFGVYAQAFDKNGQALTSAIRLNETTYNNQLLGALVAGTGRIVTTYRSPAPSTNKMHSRTFSEELAALTPEGVTKKTIWGSQYTGIPVIFAPDRLRMIMSVNPSVHTCRLSPSSMAGVGCKTLPLGSGNLAFGQISGKRAVAVSDSGDGISAVIVEW